MPPKPEGLLIRPMSMADVAGLQALCTLPGTMWGTAQIASRTLEQRQRQVESLVTDRNIHSLVAELDGRLVASATLHVGNGKRRHTGDLGLTVHDDYVGRALLEALLDLADNTLGLKRVELDVITDNAAAIHLYESLGFEREGIKRCALFRGGQFVDLLMMGRIWSRQPEPSTAEGTGVELNGCYNGHVEGSRRECATPSVTLVMR